MEGVLGEFVRIFRYTPGRIIITILGIALGFFTLTIMASMATHFRFIADRFSHITQGKLFLREGSGFFGGGALPIEDILTFSKLDGVKDVAPVLIGRLRQSELYVFGLPELIVGIPPESRDVLYKNVRLLSGRWIESEDVFGCVVGADIANEFHLNVGKKLKVKGELLEVAGILERTSGYEDKQVIVLLSTGQKLLGRYGLVSLGIIVPDENVELNELAKTINKLNNNIDVITPKQLEQSAKNAVVLWDTLAIGLGVIAVLIGTLSIITVMLLSVMERVREIGIKRTIGASRLDVFFEFLNQSFWMGVIGGGAGIGTALIFIHFFSVWLAGRGMTLFEISPGMIVTLFILASFIGLFSGSVPAYIASGFKPLRALKGER